MVNFRVVGYSETYRYSLSPAKFLESEVLITADSSNFNGATIRIFRHLTEPPLQIGYNERCRADIVPVIHRNYSFFKTLHFVAQCLQDFTDPTQHQVQT
jgi:hypothetical protein